MKTMHWLDRAWTAWTAFNFKQDYNHLVQDFSEAVEAGNEDEIDRLEAMLQDFDCQK